MCNSICNPYENKSHCLKTESDIVKSLLLWATLTLKTLRFMVHIIIKCSSHDRFNCKHLCFWHSWVTLTGTQTVDFAFKKCCGAFIVKNKSCIYFLVNLLWALILKYKPHPELPHRKKLRNRAFILKNQALFFSYRLRNTYFMGL